MGFYKTREEAIRASLTTQRYYVKIPLWFEMYSPLTVVNMQLADLNFGFKTPHIIDLIHVSDEFTAPFLSQSDDVLKDWYRDNSKIHAHRHKDSGVALTPETVFNVSMIQEVIYIDDDHRQQEMIRGESGEKNVLQQLVEVVSKEYLTPPSEFTMTLRGTNPIVEMTVLLQLRVNQVANNWYNFSRVGPAEGGRGSTKFNVDTSSTPKYYHQTKTNEQYLDPLEDLEVQINGQVRWARAKAEFLRTVPIQRCHSRLPDLSRHSYMYNISHALFPEEKHTGSGSIQSGRVEGIKILGKLNPTLLTALDPAASGIRVFVVVKMWGIFSTFSNSGGIRYQQMLQVQEY
jgi:hypothetical protein